MSGTVDPFPVLDGFPVFVDCNWESALFAQTDAPEVGQRLGIQYVRTLQAAIDVTVGSKHILLHQESMGMMAISGVVWDAGLLIADFIAQLSEHSSDQPLRRVLDLGCGTGIAGTASLLSGSQFALFSDIEKLQCFNDNIEQLSPEQQHNAHFEVYRWNSDTIPDSFLPSSTNDNDTHPTWDAVLCSDLLYESKHHDELLSVLRRIPTKRIIFSYKKRHDEAEKAFFRALSGWCAVRVVDSACIHLVNLSKTALAGLYIVVAEPSGQQQS